LALRINTQKGMHISTRTYQVLWGIIPELFPCTFVFRSHWK